MNDEFPEFDVTPKKKEKKSDPKLGILMLQFTACLILATLALCIKFFGGDFYTEVRGRYIEMFEDTTTVEEVLSVIKVPKGDNNTSSENEGTMLSSGESYTQSSSDISDASSSQPDETVSSGNSTETESKPETSSDGSIINTAYTFNFNRINQVSNMSAAKVNSLYTPTVGYVSSEYGYRVNPVTGIYALHSGIDIAADTGTPVCSALDGTVRAVGNSSSYGIYIIVTHANNVETLYAHLSAVNTAEGASVKRAETIGFVGSTGNSTGPHLHFEVHVGGKTLNPRYLLTGLVNR